MLNLDIKSVHKFVRTQQEAGNDVRWDGWDVVFFREVPHAVYSVNGVFRNNAWGFDNRVKVNSEGIWNIDTRNVKHIRRPRSRR